MTDIKTQKVLTAATHIFLEHGYTAATTDMIQQAAAVSKATVYSRYPNKTALFLAVIEQQCRELTQQISAIEFDDKGLKENLRQIGLKYLTILLSDEGLALFRVIVAETPRFNELGHTFYKSGPKVVLDIVTQQLTQACEKNEISLQPFSLQESASSFLSLLRGEGQLQCLTHPSSRPSLLQIENWVTLAIDIFFNAFACPLKTKEANQ